MAHYLRADMTPWACFLWQQGGHHGACAAKGHADQASGSAEHAQQACSVLHALAPLPADIAAAVYAHHPTAQAAQMSITDKIKSTPPVLHTTMLRSCIEQSTTHGLHIVLEEAVVRFRSWQHDVAAWRRWRSAEAAVCATIASLLQAMPCKQNLALHLHAEHVCTPRVMRSVHAMLQAAGDASLTRLSFKCSGDVVECAFACGRLGALLLHATALCEIDISLEHSMWDKQPDADEWFDLAFAVNELLDMLADMPNLKALWLATENATEYNEAAHVLMLGSPDPGSLPLTRLTLHTHENNGAFGFFASVMRRVSTATLQRLEVTHADGEAYNCTALPVNDFTRLTHLQLPWCDYDEFTGIHQADQLCMSAMTGLRSLSLGTGWLDADKLVNSRSMLREIAALTLCRRSI